MKLLIDTHALLWFLRDDPQLSAAAKTAILDQANHKFVSIASCWEIAIKAGLGKLQLGEAVGSLLTRELALNSFDLLSISLPHAASVETLPRHHKDPFDRILVAQCLLDTLFVVGADTIFDAYGVSRIW